MGLGFPDDDWSSKMCHKLVPHLFLPPPLRSICPVIDQPIHNIHIQIVKSECTNVWSGNFARCVYVEIDRIWEILINDLCYYGGVLNKNANSHRTSEG